MHFHCGVTHHSTCSAYYSLLSHWFHHQHPSHQNDIKSNTRKKETANFCLMDFAVPFWALQVNVSQLLAMQQNLSKLLPFDQDNDLFPLIVLITLLVLQIPTSGGGLVLCSSSYHQQQEPFLLQRQSKSSFHPMSLTLSLLLLLLELIIRCLHIHGFSLV